jgi:hypothetical protein
MCTHKNINCATVNLPAEINYKNCNIGPQVQAFEVRCSRSVAQRLHQDAREGRHPGDEFTNLRFGQKVVGLKVFGLTFVLGFRTKLPYIRILKT